MAVVQLDREDHQPENGFVSPETTSPGLLTLTDGSVLPFLGGFGKYQKQLIVLTWIPALFIGFSQYSDNFLLAQPNNTCIQPLANLTYHNATHSSLLDGPKNISARAARMYANGSYGTHNDTANMQCGCSEWTFELHTGLVQNVVTKWSLVCDSAWKVHIAKFSLLVGSIFGYLTFGVLADWFGRHPVLIISVLFMLVFGLTVAFSVNVPMFSTLRFFEGFCLAGIYLSLYVLRIELCLPGWRFSMTMVASFVVLGGQLLMPGVAYLCRDWQVLQAVIICPLLLMLSYIWIFPESLRWLLATQQYCRSKWIMGHIAKKNQVNMELDPDNILTELQRALQNKHKKTCIVKMVGTRNLWKNIVVLCVNSLTGYGIHHCFARSMMDPEAQETTMFHNFYADYYTMAGIAVASCMALCPAVGLMGRRGGLLMFMIITALASLLQLGLLNLVGKYSGHLNIDNSGTLNKNFSVAFSIIGMFSSHAVSNLSIFFCAEITPTVIRGGGLGLVLASAGFGMLTAPIMELHNQKGYFLHHIIFACCTLICIICILLLPETRYQPLPETLADGERYTRQPLLPPRKPGEQRLLLAQSESSRDYTRVHDTPLHEAAATAVSTMDSTASSAVDLTALSVGDISAPVFIELNPSKPVLKDPNGHSLPSLSKTPINPTLGKDGVIYASKEHLLSSTPSHQPPCATDPLLAHVEEPQSVVVESVEPLKNSASPELKGIGPSLTKESAATPSPSLDRSTPPLPQTVLASSQICTTPTIEPPPSSTLESPNPMENEISDIALKIDPPLPESPRAELPTPSMHDSLPPSPTPSPVPVPDCHISTDLPPSISANSDIPTQLEIVEQSTSTPSNRDSPIPPVIDPEQLQLDPTSPCVNDISPRPPTPPSTDTVFPSPTPPPPIDSGHTPSEASSTPPVINTVSTTAEIPTVLPVTDIVPTSTPESTTLTIQPTQDSAASSSVDSAPTPIPDSGSTEAAPSSLMDCTVSSPIDSGVLFISDSASTENNTVNGVDSL
ncbi:solute carrier family 22 member 23-like [Gymnodraco acuticeps]|uniref:Solute carrier family 22 member 23-like n=1 Tax=Gymnodraco acuticeps TaxID=8218 RepID=A0A6P8VJ02_GYMAC|nr:solute carrier family 22 member 23-like [Gymnodraco acuticeps]XP_034090395.1 solute carrier family 22 member 23-like [Gymnodraco acuticeps]